ncbi:MAG TPA: dienelactone hydrolase family protein [Thermoanaerobaculia bacterium]|jgi:carboxymethylenebutenolidase|nr:dienelactone hydrolase family protein [Thermoanaerobaculia bacterium]
MKKASLPLSVLCVLAVLFVLSLSPAVARAGADTKSDADKMAEQHKHDKPTATPAATTPPAQAVTGEDVVYATVGGQPVHGFLAHPAKASAKPLPGLIVIHEWWGLNNNIRDMAKRLAGEGYTALAIDLYGGQTADTPDKAKELMGAVLKDTAPGQENVKQAYDFLKTKEKAPQVGVIGWCFGGGWSLQTALLLPDKIAATVIYYGHLETDKAKLAPLKMPVLGFFGGKDQSIPAASIQEFEKTLKGLGKSVEIHVYDDADHAFANASGGNYNPKDAADAWKRTTAFFKKHLKG